MNSTLWWWGKKTMLWSPHKKDPCGFHKSHENWHSLYWQWIGSWLSLLSVEEAAGYISTSILPELRLWLQITGCSLYCISQIARENYELQSQVDLYYYVLLSVCGFVVIDRAVVYKKRVTWGLFAFQKIGEGIIKFWLGPKIKRGGEWKRDIISFKINFSGISNLILFFSRCVFINWTSFHCH